MNDIFNVIKAIFFDAVGTLFFLPKSVGWHYAHVARDLHLDLDERALDQAFVAAWKKMPPRDAIEGPRENDDKDWWRELVDLVLDEVAPSLNEMDRDNFFEIAYEHFAEAGVWELFPDVVDVLEKLQPKFQLAVVSNFDGRLRMILEQLGISKYFSHVFVSSEIGADKPDPEIFRRALQFMKLKATDVLHAGDDPERDWNAARAAGLSIFELDRDNFFEIAYEHFAEAGVWELYPEVLEVLEKSSPRFPLAVVSNFDGRLRMILEHHGVSKFFQHVFLSSELGADKPDPEIFRRALSLVHLNPNEVLHVGDEPERDWKAATAAGLSIFPLDRKKNSLRDLLTMLK